MTSDKDIIVRTVTVFIPPSFCRPETNFRTAVTASASHARALQAHLATYGITVQTVRISVPSPSTFGPTVSHALRAASILDEADVDYANLGMIYPDADADENDGGCFVDSSFMYNVIRLTKRVSLSISLTSKADSGMLAPVYISQRAVKQAAIAVKCISKLDPAGFSNLRFGAAANVRPNGPFFPASYAGDDDEQRILRTALGVQGATFLQSVISDNKKKSCLYEEITQGVEKAANRLIKLCKPVAHGVSVDFSTAPFPDVKDSIGDALTKCSGVSDFPSAGGLSVAARFADAIDRATFRKAGFCGIMLPVSEDVVLARCAPGLNDLLVCSAVCGTGLDVSFLFLFQFLFLY